MIKRLTNLFGGWVLDRAAFAEAFAGELKRRSPSLKVQILKDGNLLLELGEASHTSLLENAYQLYRLDPKARQDIIAKYAVAALTSLETGEAETRLEDVVPVFKGVNDVAGVREALRRRSEDPSKFELYCQPYNDEIMLAFAEDGPNNIKPLSSQKIAGLGVEDAHVLKISLNNFRALFTINVEPPGRLLRVQYGELVAVPAARDVLLACPVADALAADELRQTARGVQAQNPYSLVDTVFAWNGERWKRYEQQV